MAENSPNYQSSVLISIIFSLGWQNLSNWVYVWLKTINSFVNDQHNLCYMELGWANISLKMLFLGPKKANTPFWSYGPNLFWFGRIFFSFWPNSVQRTWQHWQRAATSLREERKDVQIRDRDEGGGEGMSCCLLYSIF